MKTKFTIILALFLMLVAQISFAQEKSVSGIVSDKSGPLPGVSVIIQGTKKVQIQILMVNIPLKHLLEMY